MAHAGARWEIKIDAQVPAPQSCSDPLAGGKLHAKGLSEALGLLNSCEPGSFTPSQPLPALQVLRHPKARQMCHPPTAFQHCAPSRHPQILPLYKLSGFPFFPYPQCRCLDCSGTAKKTPESGADIHRKGPSNSCPTSPGFKGSLRRAFSRCTLQGSTFLCGFWLSLCCSEGKYELHRQKYISPLTAAFPVAAGFSPDAGAALHRSPPAPLRSLTAPVWGQILQPPGPAHLSDPSPKPEQNSCSDQKQPGDNQ